MFFFLLSASAQSVVKNETSFSLSLELFLSILAIIISVFSVVFEYFWNQKINRTNLEAEFFIDIYGDFLMKQIPKARKYIHYNDHVVSDTDELIDVLNEIRQSSLFYKYTDIKFYKELREKLQKLEDELVDKTDKVLDDDDYAEFTKNINSSIEDIYGVIMNKYIGKK